MAEKKPSSWSSSYDGRAMRAPVLLALTLLGVLFSPSDIAAQECGETLLAGIILNDEPVEEGMLVYPSGPGYLFPLDKVEEWRIQYPADAVTSCEGQQYVRLVPGGGLGIKLIPEAQAVALLVLPQRFLKTVMGKAYETGQPADAGTGFFLNYDLSLDGGSRIGSSVGGVTEAVFFRGTWNVANSFLGRSGDNGGVARLESFWSHDDVARMQTWTAGDSITRPGLAGRPTRFAGIHWESNYATRPGYYLHPLPEIIGGLATTPSLIDLYIDTTRVASTRVAQGPFDITNIPVVGGGGEVSVVVRDLLGRQQVVVQPFYFSPLLLRRGLAKFSLEAGFPRQDYGEGSGRYGAFFLSGTHRYGINDYVTSDFRMEASSSRGMAAAGGTFRLAEAGVLSLSVAGSLEDERRRKQGELQDGGTNEDVLTRGSSGYRIIGAYDYRTKLISFWASFTESSSGYRELDEDDWRSNFRRRLIFGGSINMGRSGMAGFSVTKLQTVTGSDTRLLTGSYNLQIGPGTFSVSAYRDISASQSWGTIFSYTVILDGRKSVTSFVERRAAGATAGIDLQQSYPAATTGYAWRVRGETGDERHGVQAEVLHRGAVTEESLRYTYGSDYDHSYRAGINGSVAYVEGVAKLSRRIYRSFILAEVPGAPGVTVYADNMPVGATDSNGRLVVPTSRPYELNRLRLDAEDLPLTASFRLLETAVVPRFYAGHHVVFSVKLQDAFMVRLFTADGRPVPPGTMVQDSAGNGWPVGNAGLVYITGLPEKGVIEAEVGGRRCRAVVTPPEAEDGGIPDAGEVRCEFSE